MLAKIANLSLFVAATISSQSDFVAAFSSTASASNARCIDRSVLSMAAADDTSLNESSSRRGFFSVATSSAAAAVIGAASLSFPDAALASGGATAGKYTTIPIAKRRYYGRVSEAVHEFLAMAPAVISGDLTDATVQDFFDITKTVVVEGKKKDINGVCTKKDGDCKSNSIYDSRYNDMKTSMYLLGNAFRYNQTKAPDNLPSVKASKAFFREMNKFELKVLKNP